MFESLIRNLDAIAITVGPFEFMDIENSAVQVRDLTEEPFEVRVSFSSAQPFMKQTEQKITVKGVKLILAFFVPATNKPITEIIAVPVEKALALHEVDKH
jgi:hypothetical protein